MVSEPASVVFRKMTTPTRLRSIFMDHVDKKSARGRDGVSPALFGGTVKESCKLLSSKMRTGRLEFTQYREVLKSKGAGKNPRVVSIPTVRDRIALRALADTLVRVYPSARGLIPQVKVNEVREELALLRFDSFIRLDVEDFYPSISHAKVRDRLRKKVRKTEIIDLVMKAIRTPTVPDRAKKRPSTRRGVPQGLAISNILAELVAEPVDIEMKEDERCFYVRFVDDVLIFCQQEDVHTLAAKVTALFANEGLRVHDYKVPGGKSRCGSIVDGFEYLGYWFKTNAISVRPSSVYNVESALARAFTRYAKAVKRGHGGPIALARCKWKVNLIITGCVFQGKARGWLHYFRQMDDLTLVKRLDVTLDRFVHRFALPPSFEHKNFMRSYWEVRSDAHRVKSDAYIPNFDLVDIKQMREFLASIEGNPSIDGLSEVDVRARYRRVVGKAVAELEEDIGFVS